MNRPLTLAIVGADGSGKTTVIRELLRRRPELRYLYMGAAIDAANYALPTSRWLMKRKRRALAGVIGPAEPVPPAAIMPQELKERLPQGRLFKAIGVINRIAEEWYRLLIATLLRLRGHPVLCDRHFLFEYCPASPASWQTARRLSERIHLWQLARLYPQPDVVVFLDAPVEVLRQRKPEWTLDHLRRQREGILAQSGHTRCFARVDATQPLDAVLAEVTALIGERQAPA